MGWRNPAQQPFAHALAVLGARAEQAWLVGDEPRWDMEGAHAAGLTPVLLGAHGPADCSRIDRRSDLPALLYPAESTP